MGKTYLRRERTPDRDRRRGKRSLYYDSPDNTEGTRRFRK